MAKRAPPVELPIELVSNIREQVAGDNASLDTAISALEKYGETARAAGSEAGAVGKAGFGAAAKAIRAEAVGARKEREVAEQAFLAKYGAEGAKALAEKTRQSAERQSVDRQAARESAVAAKKAEKEQIAAAKQAAVEKEAAEKAALAAGVAAEKQAAKASEALKTSQNARVKAAVAEAKRAADAARKAAIAGDKEAVEAELKLAEAATKKAHSLAEAAHAAAYGTGSLEAYTGGLRGTLGSMGGLIEKGTGLYRALGQGGALGATIALAGGVLALGVAAVGVAAGVGKLAYSLADLAIRSSDTARSLRLVQDASFGSVAAGDAMRAQAASVAAEFGVARASVEEYAGELRSLGVSGAGAEDALRALTTAQLTGSDVVVQKVKAQIAAAKALGQGFDKVALNASKAYGDVARKQAVSLTNQLAKVKAGALSIVSGVKLEPFLKGLSQVTDIFKEGSAAVGALGAMVNALLDPILGGSEAAGASLASAFKTGIIWAAKGELAVLRFTNSLLSLVPDRALAGIDVLKTAFVVLGAVLLPFAAPVAALGVAFVAVGAAVAAVAAGITAAAVGIGAGIRALIGFFQQGYQLIAGIPWGSLGSSIVDGLVSGITGAAQRAVAAASAIANSVKQGFKSALGISSPSTVMVRYMTEGVGGGIEKGGERAEPAAQKTSEKLGDALAPRPPLPVGAGASAFQTAGPATASSPALQAAVAAASTAPPALPIASPASPRAPAGSSSRATITLRLEANGAPPVQVASAKDFLEELAGALEAVGVEMAVAL